MNISTTQFTTAQFDDAGLLLDAGMWNVALAQQIAFQNEIGMLTEDHWKIIYALRAHYEKFGVAPAMQNICHDLGRGRFWVHDLFHTCLNAWRVAGLPNPGEEAKTYLSGN